MLKPVHKLHFYNHIFHTITKITPLLLRITKIRCKSEISPQKMSKDWVSEKSRIMGLSPEEKRKLYKSGKYITVNTIDSWNIYKVKNNNDIVNKVPNEDDINEFGKIIIDPSKNRTLSEKVSIFRGDITHLEVDAIVNAANSALRAGGGVDGAIHRAAGPLLQQECNTLNGCPTGEAKITGGYNLPAKYVIHTVGPQDGSAAKLRSCYENCLKYQQEYGLKSIAFPCISTGIYGFPNRLASHIALSTARKFLETNSDMERIIFCTFMPIDVDIYVTLMKLYFPTD